MNAVTPMMESKLLSLLTGELGNRQNISKICSELGQVFVALLPDMIESETRLHFLFAYDGFETGLKSELIQDLDEYQILSDVVLKNWCDDFTIACSTTATTALVECMLGGSPDEIIEPEARPASSVELEMAPMILSKIADVIRTAVKAPGNYEPISTKPYNAEKRPRDPDDYVDLHAAKVKMRIEFGKLISHFSVIIPQRTLLKTVVQQTMLKTGAKKVPEGWTERLQDKVRRSDVKVEARVNLTPLKLDMIARLQPGDVIPFFDAGDVNVQVSANGRDLYICEFGRSGEQYTVRVKDTAGTERPQIQDLLG